MYKILAVAVVYCLALQAAGNDDRCSAVSIMRACSPDFEQFLQYRETVNSVSALTVANNATGFLVHCPRFIAEGQCALAKFQENGCTVPTDAASPIVIRSRAAGEAIQIVCVDKVSEFAAARACLSSDAVRQALQACADAANHETTARRKRHTCIDYSNEVNCAGRAVRSSCPDIAAVFYTFVGKLLRSTANTALCIAPTVLTS